MANNTISMQKIRQVLRLRSQGKGLKAISGLVGIARNTVKKYLSRLVESGLDLEAALSLSDLDLQSLLQEQPIVPLSSKREILESLLPVYCKRLKRKGVTKEMLHQEYKSKYPDGYSRSGFCRHIQLYEKIHKSVMHLEHKAGDKLYIDFAGKKLSIVDIATGEVIPVEVFVAILPCSQLTYVEAVASQRKEDLILACEHTLQYLEGVPQVIVPDNLRSAVTKSSKYEAVINEDFASFADHYACTVIPARAYKPRDKALVEGAVKLIYRSIYLRLETRTFHDLKSLNAAIRVALEVHNNTPFSGRSYSRRDQFEEIERMTLRQLNPIRYELKAQAIVTVMKNGHIRLSENAHYYSVPCKYIGKKVKVLYTSSLVEIYYRYEKLAEHTRSYARFKYTTDKDHLASHHREYADWSEEKFITEANTIHSDVGIYITKVMESKAHPEQAYKSARGILSFARRVGERRLINACRWADSYGLYSYPAIENILSSGQDQIPLENETDADNTMPVHKNIRGKDYYN
jgi:Transposase and inactivated derivatives